MRRRWARCGMNCRENCLRSGSRLHIRIQNVGFRTRNARVVVKPKKTPKAFVVAFILFGTGSESMMFNTMEAQKSPYLQHSCKIVFDFGIIFNFNSWRLTSQCFLHEKKKMAKKTIIWHLNLQILVTSMKFWDLDQQLKCAWINANKGVVWVRIGIRSDQHHLPCRIRRETREGWPLLTVATEVNGDSKESGSFHDEFIGLVVLVQEIFVLPWLL